jgi:hypothetical protein
MFGFLTRNRPFAEMSKASNGNTKSPSGLAIL